MNKKSLVSDRNIERAVAYSSKLEGIDYSAAKKDKQLIKLLQKHGRALSL